MARIAGVDLPGRKHVWIGLTRIFGIGNTKGREICVKARIELSKASTSSTTLRSGEFARSSRPSTRSKVTFVVKSR